MILAAIICILATALASGLHGWGKVTKGLVMAGHAAACVGAAAMAGLGWWSVAVGVVASLLWWFTLRTGWQAKAELDYMGLKSKSWLKVVLAYLLPVGVCAGLAGYFVHPMLAVILVVSIAVPPLSVRLFNYGTDAGKALGWNHGRFMDARRATELIAGAAPGGLCVASLIVLAEKMIYVPA